MSIMHEIRHVLSPLRRLGLYSGRSLANAQPSAEQVRFDRAVQLAYIRAAPRHDERPAA